jgi:hypothetical protein
MSITGTGIVVVLRLDKLPYRISVYLANRNAALGNLYSMYEITQTKRYFNFKKHF